MPLIFFLLLNCFLIPGFFAYQYENNGVKKSVKHELANGLQKTDTYEYDSHNRLIEANYTGKQFGQDRFYLDSLDNITDGLMNAQPIKMQIKEAVRIAQSNEVNFLYDTRGNTIEDEQYQYEWDDFDRIRSIKNKAINPENYVQDRPYEALRFETASENHLYFTMVQDDQAPVTVNSLFINKEVVNSLYLEYKLFSNEENWQSLVISRSLINSVEHSTRLDFSDISARQIRLTEFASSGPDFVLLESENPQFQFKDYHYPEGIWSEIEYLYDASGRRVEKILDNRQAFWYSFDAYQMLEEKTFTSSDNTPKLRRQITYGKAINEPIYIYDAKANKNYYLLKNEQNTVLAVYDANDNTNASLKEQYEYSSYGITNILDAAGNCRLAI